MSGYVDCPQCHGRGVVAGDFVFGAQVADCDLCKGTGEVRADVAMEHLERTVTS